MKYLLPHHIIICIIANYKKFLRLHPVLSSGGFTCIWSQLVVLDSIQIIAETIGNIHHRRLSRCNHSRPKHTINNNEFLMHLSLSLYFSLVSFPLFLSHTTNTHYGTFFSNLLPFATNIVTLHFDLQLLPTPSTRICRRGLNSCISLFRTRTHEHTQKVFSKSPFATTTTSMTFSTSTWPPH